MPVTVTHERRDRGVEMHAHEDVRTVVTEMVYNDGIKPIRFTELPEVTRERIQREAEAHYGAERERIVETFSTRTTLP